MDYLSRVLDQLKQTTWEKFGPAVKDTLICLGLMVGSALVYWGLDKVMSMLIKHL